jgi:hypothetical protein
MLFLGAGERNAFGAKTRRAVADRATPKPNFLFQRELTRRNRLPLMRLTSLFLLPIAFLIAQNRNVPVENEFVRVLSVVDRPVVKPGALHEHKQNRVMIYLDSGDIQIRYADGKVDDQHWKAGDVAWSPASGMHTSQNVSSSPVRIVEIELKSEGGGKGSAGKALIDNPQVRVYKTSKPVTATNYVAVDVKTATVLWNKLPEGPGPFVITELKPRLHGDNEPR